MPEGFAVSQDELLNIDISIDFDTFTFQDSTGFSNAQIIANGKVFNNTENNLTTGFNEWYVNGSPGAPLNRLSWNENETYPATFDIFNFSYAFNGIGRTYNLNESIGSATSTDGNGLFTPSASSWITDSSLGTGLRFSQSLEAIWDDPIPFNFDNGANINFSASLKFQDVLPYHVPAEGYGLVAQFDYIDPVNTNIMYSLKVYGDRGDDDVISSTPCSNNEEICVVQPLKPVSCTDKYVAYLNVLNALGIDTITEGDNRDSQYHTEDDFCAKQFAHIMDDYEYYINTLVLSETDPEVIANPILSIHYLTIAEFGATEFGYGYNPNPDDNISGMVPIIDDYAVHVQDNVSNIDNIQTWSKYTSDYLYELTNQGTACISLPAILPITTNEYPIDLPEDSPCQQLEKAIYTSYSNDAYQEFLKNEREDFINEYLKHAMGTVVENFGMTYYDREYQYTLYYYDQAGNLTQTIPPEGVNRFAKDELEDKEGELTLNERINEHRSSNIAVENADLLPQHDYKTQYVYNSLNQLVWQFTPDGDETRFAYDALGRIVASQNAKQLDNNTFSYTTYDELGRIIEAGELVPNTGITINQTTGKLIETASENIVYTNSFTDDDNPVAFPKNVSDQQNEVTRTKYTEYIVNLGEVFKTYDANTLFVSPASKVITSTSRNRVTEVYYFDTVTATTSNIDYNNVMYYNYDIHGNVKELVHHNRLLAKSQGLYSGLKRVEYEYDLISGNVNKVYYQKDAPDQFIHQYTYDADNRITAVQTSSDGMVWEQDASYDYFAHGPLARTELGDKKVQGQDYAYTIQGWLKGVNSDEINPTNDLGTDGNSGSNVAQDAYGYALTYNDEDYTPIGSINAFVNSNASGPNNTRNLYNGNIKQMITDVMNTDETVLGSQVNHYAYDQLNRIITMQGYNASGATNYYADYAYDNNGNLKTLNRKADVGQDMDQLGYAYTETKLNPLTGELSKNNQLTSVTDNIGDIGLNDLGGVHNYAYDKIGQLTSDFTEGITNINWRVDGKVASIIKDDNTEIHFKYDGLGNRIAKTVLPENKTTIYTRDAQGNVLAVYETNETDTANITANKAITLKEHHIYGSSRLGIEQKSVAIPEDGDTLIIQENLVLTTDNITTNLLIQAENSIEVAGNSNTYIIEPTGNVTMQAGNQITLKPGFTASAGSNFIGQIQSINASLPENTFIRLVGDKRYELSNHLGNVLSVISDRKLVKNSTFTPDVLAYNDYYPFGMLLPNRHGSSDSYRYGFNGKEKDDEVKGEGVQYDYGFRIYDPRLGKFLSQDPLFKSFPWYTPYQYAGNKPTIAIDLDGKEEEIVIKTSTDGDPQILTASNYNSVEWKNIRKQMWLAYGGGDAGKWLNGYESYSSPGWRNVDGYGTAVGMLIITAIPDTETTLEFHNVRLFEEPVDWKFKLNVKGKVFLDAGISAKGNIGAANGSVSISAVRLELGSFKHDVIENITEGDYIMEDGEFKTSSGASISGGVVGYDIIEGYYRVNAVHDTENNSSTHTNESGVRIIVPLAKKTQNSGSNFKTTTTPNRTQKTSSKLKTKSGDFQGLSAGVGASLGVGGELTIEAGFERQ